MLVVSVGVDKDTVLPSAATKAETHVLILQHIYVEGASPRPGGMFR